jgi:hypothetical protein
MIFRYFLLLLIINTTLIFSAPGVITNKLIKDQPSMMDFGILKLDLKAREMASYAPNYSGVEAIHVSGGALYDWSDDTIVINFYHLFGDLDKKELKDYALNVSNILNLDLFDLYNSFFTHAGYTVSSKELTTTEAKKFISRTRVTFSSVKTTPKTYAFLPLGAELIFYDFTMKDKTGK